MTKSLYSELITLFPELPDMARVASFALRRDAQSLDTFMKNHWPQSIPEFIKSGKTPNGLPVETLFINDENLYPELKHGFLQDPTIPAILAVDIINTEDKAHDEILLQILTATRPLFQKLVPASFKIPIEEAFRSLKAAEEPKISYQGNTHRYGGIQSIYLDFDLSKEETMVYLRTSFKRDT